MKMPKRPPSEAEIWKELRSGPARLAEIFSSLAADPEQDRYLHWEKLLYYSPPPDLSHREWWLALKISRRAQSRTTPMLDKSGRPFRYCETPLVLERLHDIDLGAGGLIGMPREVSNPETKDRYLVASLLEEAITSSQLEGAATTREDAKDMIRSGRTPRDRSERMILNNYLTMGRLGNLRKERLTEDLIFEIHKAVTDQTLEDPSAAGRLCKLEEHRYVGDDLGRVFHDPPPAEGLGQRLAALCDFANGKTPGGFVHPVIRSIILHFWLAYDHPFVDGNGRTARALVYWSMLRRGYWLFEFISISRIILKGPAKYGRAFLYTETDENDLTYFLIYHLDIIGRAIKDLHEYIKRKTRQLRALEACLRGAPILNHRQRALLSHALRHPQHRYTIQSHRVSHNVVHQTARTDLLDLAKRGLLEGRKIGRQWHFTVAPDLEERLAALG